MNRTFSSGSTRSTFQRVHILRRDRLCTCLLPDTNMSALFRKKQPSVLLANSSWPLIWRTITRKRWVASTYVTQSVRRCWPPLNRDPANVQVHCWTLKKRENCLTLPNKSYPNRHDQLRFPASCLTISLTCLMPCAPDVSGPEASSSESRLYSKVARSLRVWKKQIRILQWLESLS